MDAFGSGITGGDPLLKIERTIHYIQKLKEKYGEKFHIHLYTSLNLVTREKLQKLSTAGLDEIRFHLDLDSTVFWKNVEIAKDFPWKVGVELPLLPSKKKELQEVIDFINGKKSVNDLSQIATLINEEFVAIENRATPQQTIAINPSFTPTNNLSFLLLINSFTFTETKIMPMAIKIIATS